MNDVSESNYTRDMFKFTYVFSEPTNNLSKLSVVFYYYKHANAISNYRCNLFSINSLKSNKENVIYRLNRIIISLN